MYRNLEILLIDDGSPDRCPERCDAWARKDSRIKVFHTENHGVSHARNVGLDQATGDYIGFVDPDDWVDPDMYQVMVETMLKENADVHGGGYVVEHLTRRELVLETGKPCVFSARQALREMFVVPKRPLFTWSLWDKLIRHELVTKLRFDETLALSEDQYFLWQVLTRANRFSYVPQFAYHYRMREGSATHQGLDRTKGTHLDAMQRIVREASAISDMDAETLHVLNMKYHQIANGVMKEILLQNRKDFQDVLLKEQKNLRKDFFACLREQGLSKLGTCYLALPNRLLWMLQPLLGHLRKSNTAI